MKQQISNNSVVGMGRYVDIHCHCLPGFDDGPATMANALSLCRALVKDEIAVVVATPHQLGRFDGKNEADAVRQGVFDLNRELKSKNIPLIVFAGADVRLDERIPYLIEADRVLTVGDNNQYLMLEIPHEVFINPEPLIAQLASDGIKTIVSHPERNEFICNKPKTVLPWLKHGACLQVTAASLSGDFGTAAKMMAWNLLRSGQAKLVATDAHDCKTRVPRMSDAFRLISKGIGVSAARRICIENPKKVLEGKVLEPAANSVEQEVCG